MLNKNIMKTLYITGCLLFGSLMMYAQQKTISEIPEQNQEQIVKEAKEHQALMAKYHENPPANKQKQATLASEEGLEIKSQPRNKQESVAPATEKLLPNTATLHEILETLPNRQQNKKTQVKKVDHVQGLPNTATLQEVLKTKPRE